MEQLAARWAHNPKVVGSSPAPATNKSQKIFSSGFLFARMQTTPAACMDLSKCFDTLDRGLILSSGIVQFVVR